MKPSDVNFDPRPSEVLQKVKEQLANLELEALQIRTRLARYEAAQTSALANQLDPLTFPAELSDHESSNDAPLVPRLTIVQQEPATSPRIAEISQPAPHVVRPVQTSTRTPAATRGYRPTTQPGRPKPVIPSRAKSTPPATPRHTGSLRAWIRLKKGPGWLVSICVHMFIIGLLAVFTFATAVPIPMLTMTLAPATSVALEMLQPVEITTPADSTTSEPVVEPLSVAPADLAPDEAITPDGLIDHSAADHPLHDAISDLLASANEPLGEGAGGNSNGKGNGDGTEGAGRGSTTFFGSPARADRIVFMVDNSGSMGDGRLETALWELQRSVEQLSNKQSFYVIFYSDVAYGLFYPEPADGLVRATRENKLKLAQWLRTVEMCNGGNVDKAFQMAERLEPQLAYLLSDGEIISPRILEYLLDGDSRPFAVHTIGLTVPNAESEQKLMAIARANRGSFRSVGVDPRARLSARQFPIKKNRTPGTVWGIEVKVRDNRSSTAE